MSHTHTDWQYFTTAANQPLDHQHDCMHLERFANYAPTRLDLSSYAACMLHCETICLVIMCPSRSRPHMPGGQRCHSPMLAATVAFDPVVTLTSYPTGHIRFLGAFVATSLGGCDCSA